MWLVHWPVIMACYDWTEEEMVYFLQAVKEQNVSTILDTNNVNKNCHGNAPTVSEQTPHTRPLDSPPIRESNTISVWNNGKGIPVVEHKDEKMYVPALIFGHLLTSSNYDDDEKKVTGERRAVEEARRLQPSASACRLGLSLLHWLFPVCLAPGGRNGYGAKLCNIFSTKFTVETACKEYRHSFKQVGRTSIWTLPSCCATQPGGWGKTQWKYFSAERDTFINKVRAFV